MESLIENKTNEPNEISKIEELYEHASYEEALSLLNESLTKSISKSERVKLLLLKGDIYKELDENEEAVTSYREALDEAEKNQDFDGIYRALKGLAVILNTQTTKRPLFRRRIPNQRRLVASLPSNLSLCPECGGFVVDSHTRNDYVCYNCGLIIWRKRIIQESSTDERGDFITHIGYYGDYENTAEDLARQKQLHEFIATKDEAFYALRKRLIQSLLETVTNKMDLQEHILETAYSIYQHNKKALQQFRVVDLVTAVIIKSSNNFSYKLDESLLYQIIDSEDKKPNEAQVDKILSVLK